MKDFFEIAIEYLFFVPATLARMFYMGLRTRSGLVPKHSFDPEKLRPLEYICEPDPRNAMLVLCDLENKSSSPLSIDYFHKKMASFALNPAVPMEIAIQFETAKNLYLYSWYIYRFYSVAEQHSLFCLEYALRERLSVEIHSGKIKPQQVRLHYLFKYAIDHGLVKNEGYSAWQNRGAINSLRRVQAERTREAIEKNMTSGCFTLNESDIQVTEEDMHWDYIGDLLKMLPKIRNEYAHGSPMLHNWSAPTIEIVCETINQLFVPTTEAPI